MKTAVIFIGIQASGKSSYYARCYAGDYVRINLDTLKTRHRERLLFEDCLAKGCSFVVDNTDPQASDRARYIPEAKAAGYRIIGCYFPPDVAFSLEHNRLREGKARVPDAAIWATAAKLEPPTYAEGFDELYRIDNDGRDFTAYAIPFSAEGGSASPA